MPSLRPVLWFVVICGLMVPQGLSAAAPSMDTLLPKTTVGFVSATNSIRLTEQWNKTQLGKLMADPVMKPFEEDLRAQLQAQWSTLADRLGIHLDDLQGVSTGEASLALLEPQPGTAATSLLLDVTGNLDKAKALLAKARAGLKGRRRQETIQTIRGIPVYVFDVPLPQAQQVAAGQGGAAAAAATGQTVYFLTENLFGACDDLAVVQEILARLANGSPAGSLSQVAGVSNGHEALRGRRPRPRARHPLVHLSLGLRRGNPGRHPAGKAAQGQDDHRNHAQPGLRGLPRRGRLCRRFRRRLPDPPSHRRFRPAAVHGIDEDVRLSQRQGLHSATLGRPRRGHLFHGLRRYPQRLRQFRPLVRRNHRRRRRSGSRRSRA